MKFEWLKYIKDVLPGLVKSKLKDLAAQALIGFGGLKGWVAKIIVKKVLKYLDINFTKLVNIAYGRIKAGIDERNYQDRINKPDADAEDIRDAARDLIDGKP